MKRVLLVHPSLQPPGGGNGLAAWVLQSLVGEHDVTVLSWTPVEVVPINRFFGTHLRPGDFKTLLVPRGRVRIIDGLPIPAALIKLALLMRYTRRVSEGFDVIFGLYNETDYGRRGIQYINYPTYLRPRPGVDLRWYHHASVMLRLYYACADAIAGVSRDRLKQNVTLVNSNWTGARVRTFLDVQTRTLYPPVVDPLPPPSWVERRPDFLAVGRISPEKEYERLMRILARVRQHHPNLTLTIVGTCDRHTRRYFDALTALASSLGSWIALEQDLPRDEVRRLMAAHRYGIHGMREEHFGMAPAELVRAGQIVWVPRGGGQMEIVGEEPALMYDTDDDAVEKILAVMASPAEQGRLRDLLAERGRLFSTDRFVREVRDIVGAFS
jgi:glycosyltransferase involved in cell wall biosynthesis